MSQAEDDSEPGDVACPTCGAECANEHGVKIHHKRVHGESIAGVEIECAECGDTERIEPWKDKRAERNFCSEACRRQAGRVSGVCHQCGDTFTRKESNFPDADRHFCEPACRHEFIGGENHPRYKPEVDRVRDGADWKSVAREVRQRDNYVCQLCGKLPIGQAVHPHHIVKRRLFQEWETEYECVSVEDSNVPRNLILLCASCHPKVEHGNAECPVPEGHWRAE